MVSINLYVVACTRRLNGGSYDPVHASWGYYLRRRKFLTDFTSKHALKTHIVRRTRRVSAAHECLTHGILHDGISGFMKGTASPADHQKQATGEVYITGHEIDPKPANQHRLQYDF